MYVCESDEQKMSILSFPGLTQDCLNLWIYLDINQSTQCGEMSVSSKTVWHDIFTFAYMCYAIIDFVTKCKLRISCHGDTYSYRHSQYLLSFSSRLNPLTRKMAWYTSRVAFAGLGVTWYESKCSLGLQTVHVALGIPAVHRASLFTQYVKRMPSDRCTRKQKMLSQQGPNITQSILDPFPHERVASGDETSTCSLFSSINLSP